MNASRIRVGLAVGLMGLALTTGTATALEGTPCSNCDVLPDNAALDTNVPTGQVEAETLTNSAPATSLAFTGGDIAGLVLLGGAAAGVGTLLVRRSRTAE